MTHQLSRRTMLTAAAAGLVAGALGCTPHDGPSPTPGPTPAGPALHLDTRRIPIAPFGKVERARVLGDVLHVQGDGDTRTRFSAIDLAAGRELFTYEAGRPLGQPWEAGLTIVDVLGWTEGRRPLVLLSGYEGGERSREVSVALDARTGELRWRQPAAWFAADVAGDDDVVVVSRSGSTPTMRALDPATGTTRWEAPGIAQLVTPAHVLGAERSPDSVLAAWDRATGTRARLTCFPPNRGKWLDARGSKVLADSEGDLVVLDLAADAAISPRLRASLEQSGLGVAGDRLEVAGGDHGNLYTWREGDAAAAGIRGHTKGARGIAGGIVWARTGETQPDVPLERGGRPVRGGPGVVLEVVDEHWLVEKITADLPTLTAHRWEVRP